MGMTFEQKQESIEALERAAAVVGTVVGLAEELGVVRQTIYTWKKSGKIPADRVPDIVEATEGEVEKSELRPDLFD